MFKYKDLVAHKFMYSDKLTGVGWEIEVFETFRNESDNATVILLTDNVRVEMTRFDTIKGSSHVINKIMESYGNAMNKLEYTNV